MSPVGFEPMSPDHQSNALPTELRRNLLVIPEVSFLLFHVPLHMLNFVFSLESIEHDDLHSQPNSDLAQLAEHETDDLEVMSSKPSGGNF